MKNIISLLFLYCLFMFSAYSQTNCYSRLDGDTLSIGNTLIERKFNWNGGNLITYSLTDKKNGHCWLNKSHTPDFIISKSGITVSDASCHVTMVKATEIRPSYLQTEVSFTLGDLDVKRVYRIYENCPVIACETYLKGVPNSIFGGREMNSADKKNIEFASDMHSKQLTPVLDQLNLGGKHWSTKVVEFYDVTDWNNNLVAERTILPYRKTSYRGNLLFAINKENNGGIFFLKEAPCSSVQLAYNGADFSVEFGHFMLTGLGLTEQNIKTEEWVQTYSYVIGIFGNDELNALTALRTYQKNVRTLLPGRDEMVMMNTWGDRSQDSKVNEAFCLKELERAAQLGISHFQIDDGWQTGKSPNSAIAKGSFTNIWDNPEYWKPDKIKYPRGLHPITKKGKELGIEICLWFNPSVQNNFADWEKDAQALIDLYTEYGIRTFKIDGLSIPTKQAEVNLRKLFEKVLEKTNNQVVFNLDATAGRRAGYHMLNEYGNIFLENRYTDWQNYYPYWTLRNLWMLSRYVPAEKLQIEFLNKWRNKDKYGNDLFAPANYSFEYLFAITMAAQPLAWFEGTNLPKEALSIRKTILSYRKIQRDFHQGTILPIGKEPSGKSWTGFQSINGKQGYLLIFRENNLKQQSLITTWLPENSTVICVPVLGQGKAMKARVGENGSLKVELPAINTYVLYHYELAK